MTAKVTILTAPPRSGKTAQLLADYRRSLATGSPGESLWLAPTQRSADEIRDRLLDTDRLTACFSPAVMTFERFADSVLARSPIEIRPLERLAKRQLLRRILDTAHAESRLDYFTPIVDTSGMVDLVARFISEMKRLEIWPDDFRNACSRRGATAKDLQLAEIYHRYQQHLNDHRLYDAEGRFWSARDLLQRGEAKPFEQIRLVVADGFADFTWTQHEILEILASRAEHLFISLPLESERRRNVLFAKPQQTFDELQRRHRGNIERRSIEGSSQHVDSGPPTPFQKTLSHLVDQLFLDPRRVTDDVAGDGITIIAASGQVAEVERVAATVKTLLRTRVPSAGESPSQVRPSEIVVAFRTLSSIAPLVREIFTEYGIPFALASGVALVDTPVIKSLVQLLEVATGDWPFRKILAVISNNFIRPTWPELSGRDASHAAERLIRELQLPQGRNALLARIDRLATEEPSEPSPQQRQRQSSARDAWPLLSGLARSFDALPTRASASQWADALRTLANDLGMLPCEDPAASVPEGAGTDLAAWKHLVDALCKSDRLALWFGDSPPQLTFSQLVDRVAEILQCEQLPSQRDTTGCVRVVSAAGLRTLRVPYLLLAGLSEQAFPARDHDDPIYNESQRSELIEGGLRLPRRAERASEEMLLFYEAVTRATEHLWLCYPAMNEKAQPLLPSPYVTEIERIFRPKSIEQIVPTDLGPIAPDPLPLSRTDLRVRAMHDAVEGDPNLLKALAAWPPMRSPVANLGRGLAALDDRGQQACFGHHEGLFFSDKAIAELAQRFGPNTVWSASRLEEYGKCPFRFYLDRVLQIEPLPELEVETDHLTRGRLLHDALAATHRELNLRSNAPTSPTEHPPEQFLIGFRQHLEALAEQVRRDTPLDRALLQIDLALLLQLAEVYLDQHRKYDEKLQLPLMPKHFEISFGLSIENDDAVDPRSTPLPLVIGEGEEAVCLAGRIDRVDVAEIDGRILYNIVDYKSGSASGFRSPKDATIDAGHLQLDIYALAAAKVLFADVDALPWQSGYWFVKTKGFTDWVSMHEQENTTSKDGPSDVGRADFQETSLWIARRKHLADLVVSLVRGVRGGQFPVFSNDDQCTGHCPHHTICRVNQIRALEKKWQPPATNRS